MSFWSQSLTRICRPPQAHVQGGRQDHGDAGRHEILRVQSNRHILGAHNTFIRIHAYIYIYIHMYIYIYICMRIHAAVYRFKVPKYVGCVGAYIYIYICTDR